jgi:Arc-like DNA binding domain
MARVRKPSDTVNLRLRLPEALRIKLVSEADRNKRSINSEILYRLGQTFGEEFLRFIAGIEEREEREKRALEQLSQNPEFQKWFAQAMADLTEKYPEARKDK